MGAAHGNVAGVLPVPSVRDRYSKAPRGDFELCRSVIFREEAAPTGGGSGIAAIASRNRINAALIVGNAARQGAVCSLIPPLSS
jgi:hypothetical protein